MDEDPPIKPEPSGSGVRFIKPEPLEDPMMAPPISGVASAQPSHRSPTTHLSASSASLSSDPFSPVRQTEPGMSTSPNAPIKADPEIEQDKNLNSPHVESSSTNYLDQLITVTVPETLESGVTIGVDLLDQLKVHLSTFKNLDVDTWLDTINTLKESAKPTRTVVGVVGNTGAGKSSVINALLDEERLLPTNCIRACTASPTEISYNHSDDPSELYRAEIEFITAEEWIKELEILFNDLLDGNGAVSRDSSNADSEAGVAYAKLKAVYPHKTKEMIAEGTPQDFAKEPAVRGVLGTTKTLKENSAKSLYGRLQHYVDSKEKITGHENKKRNVPMEYWPLIKVVRIYTKAKALSTGAVLVDLPGVQDSNAARAAVAEKYMKSCTGLWIVAPITRAVDDKTAKSLLGDSFKRQLKYDGTYSAVTFICSKTDDISITEAIDSLGLEEELSESWSQAAELKDSIKTSQSFLEELTDKKAALGEQVDEIEANLDIWEDLQSQLSSGEVVYAPFEKSRKRKRRSKSFQSRKSRSPFGSDIDNVDDDDGQDAYEDDSSDKENSQSIGAGQPLTSDDIEEKLASLRAQKREIRDKRRGLDTQIADARKQIREARAERQGILAEIKARCIQGRNNYSRGAIKQDFAMGIKELDQEHAAEEDDTTFDPDQDIRDYDEVARTLPVFCVSSRAYQSLTGKLQKDDFQDHGFMSLEDTEIPQLQLHAKKLTEEGRASNCRRFLNELTQLINSMKLWASNDGTHSTLTDVEKRREEMHLRKLLNDLETGFDTSIRDAVKLLKESLQEHVYSVFAASIPGAISAAPNTASGWSAPKQLGGMVWATYKATVRRNGVYSGASGPRDFNQELFDPISRSLATGWERAFQRRLPAILDEFAAKAKKQLKAFHEAAQTRARQRHTNISGIVTLSSQILAHMRTIEQLPITLRVVITDLQREASRKFTPAICNAMEYAYRVCTEERGPGSYNRMKAAMANHVETSRYTMFNEATDTVKAELEAMCRTVQKSLSDQMEDMFSSIFRDYMKVLVGTEVDRRAKLSPEELAMRANVNNFLQHCDLMFSSVLGEKTVDERMKTGDTTQTSEADPIKEDENEYGGGVASVKIEAPAETQASIDVPGEANSNHAMQDAEDNPTLAEADELMQQQIRAQSVEDEWNF
ncbi:Dynamin family-domain-containing protein [Daldinia vernicosa]|uniref:Dynamin family-domain-containing protein n=1 Tax=Daldinia vernicosa TaxID=114800 RepID=UPI00200738F1|nr:Dynamin family-domain-containing protein [Daldinia vernicosa]KAI0854147.1 Dynamin family-domain-containing protein [Daldinia vernicosa]